MTTNPTEVTIVSINDAKNTSGVKRIAINVRLKDDRVMPIFIDEFRFIRILKDRGLTKLYEDENNHYLEDVKINGRFIINLKDTEYCYLNKAGQRMAGKYASDKLNIDYKTPLHIHVNYEEVMKKIADRKVNEAFSNEVKDFESDIDADVAKRIKAMRMKFNINH